MKFAAEQTGSSRVGRHVVFEVRQERGEEDGEQSVSRVRVSDTGVRATVPGTEYQLQIWNDGDSWSRTAELDKSIALAIGEAAIRFKMVLDSALPTQEG